MKFIWLIFLCCPLYASTFVGNGGNAGDVELRVALNQIKESLIAIQKDKDLESKDLCECPANFQGHPICEILLTISEAQRKFCGNFIQKNTSELISILETPEAMKVIWTHQNIEVSEDAHQRASDAVTQTEPRQITLNQDRFLKMKAYERVFLLTHELIHLIKFEGHYIQDTEPIGEFDSKEGGRELLNSIGSSLVIQSYQYGITDRSVKVLNRSQFSKPYWFSIRYESMRNGEGNSNFSIAGLQGSQFEFRYQWSAWGAYARFRSSIGEKSVLGSTKSRETQSATGVGINYLLRPFSDPLTFWGQSHFGFGLGIDVLKSSLKVSDSYISDSSQVDSTALSLDIGYYFPLNSGFWVSMGVGYLGHRPKYKIFDTEISSNSPQISSTFGVSYAF